MVNISILSKQENIGALSFIRNSCLVNVIALFTHISHEYFTVGIGEIERTFFFLLPSPTSSKVILVLSHLNMKYLNKISSSKRILVLKALTVPVISRRHPGTTICYLSNHLNLSS